MGDRPSFVHLAALGLLILGAACSESKTPPAGGGGNRPDAGPTDTGLMADTGTTARDSGLPAPDTGLADAGSGSDTGVEGDAGESDAGTGLRCAQPTAVPCTDQQVIQMVLYTNVAAGPITRIDNTNGVFTETIDARAGGMNPTQSFTYARFTANGLEKLNISDEAAFDEMGWDIAFRRYVVRVNSGVGGPSCVQAARVPGTTDFDAVTAVTPNLNFRTEAYFATDTCDLVPDGSGLPGSAAVALGSYWSYTQCVQMTDNVFVLALADGRHVKLQIMEYYSAAGAQDTCDATGAVPQPSGSAIFTIRWAFLP